MENKNWLNKNIRADNEKDKKEQIEDLVVFYFMDLLDNISIDEALTNPDQYTIEYLNTLGLEISDAQKIMIEYMQKQMEENPENKIKRH